MAKAKNKKKSLSDHVQGNKKLKQIPRPKNPFEIHINNEKIKVLNRKRKTDVGLPGVSRSKAITRRKQTLLEEYKIMNKSNKFTDRRIGEFNTNLSMDEKQMARYAAVRVKSHNRKSKYNLGDDEILTHRGQTLSEIENFDDPRSEEEDEEETGKLDKQFVEEAHFGGGMLRKVGEDGAKTHKDLINELIAESKKRKVEMQKNKEATKELTEKLDSEWKDLLPLVNKKDKKEDQSSGQNVEDYDKVMRELKFEARGTVSDRLKSEEEIAKEEKERLEQLEKDRLERMKGIDSNAASKKSHRSADDLDDGFIYETVDDYTLTYNEEGEANIPVKGEIIKPAENSEQDENNDDAEEEEEDSDDNLSDLKEDSESENEEDNVEPNKEEIKTHLLKLKEKMDQAREELPYTFTLPSSYKDLYDALNDKSEIHQGIIIERMIKCNHSSLAEKNKKNLGLLFAYILQYLNDTATESSTSESTQRLFKIFENLASHLYELAQMNPANAHNSVKEVVKEKFGDYWKKEKTYPGLENLIFFKLVGMLFTTSDFRHQVVTPCFVFIEQMLTRCRVSTKRDIAYGLFLVTIVLEFTSLSKRYLPAVINFLGGIVHMAIPKTVKIIKVLKPFKNLSSDLVLVEDHSASKDSLQMEVSDLSGNAMEEIFKIKALKLSVNLLSEFLENFKELPSCVEIFQPLHNYLELIPTDNYPDRVKKEIENLINSLDELSNERKLKYLVMPDKKPKALRLYEPKVEEVYDRKKHKVQSKEKAERDKLLHKLKRETKGALREIRRDNAFITRIKITNQLRSDRERKEKVKRIFSEASIQQSELNEIDRKKRKK